MWIHGKILTDFLPAHLRKKDRRLQVRAGKVSRNFQRRLRAEIANKPCPGQKRPYTTVIYVCRVHCSKKNPPYIFRYYRETPSYSRISLRKPSTAENIIIHGSRRKFAQVKFQRQAKETRSKNTVRDIYSRWPRSFFLETQDARSFSYWESWNIAKTIDPYGFNKNIFVKVSKNI